MKVKSANPKNPQSASGAMPALQPPPDEAEGEGSEGSAAAKAFMQMMAFLYELALATVKISR